MGIKKHQAIRSLEKDERKRPRDLDGLISELKDENPVARRWAARDLGQYAEAAPILIDHIKQEKDGSVREAILTSLTRIKSPIVVAGLAECLRSEDAALRNDAIDAIKNLPQEMVMPIISNMLSDSNPDIRIFAINILESIQHPDLEKWLIEIISKDSHVNVCATAVDLLAEVGTEAAISALKNLKERFLDEPFIAFSVDMALRRIQRTNYE